MRGFHRTDRTTLLRLLQPRIATDGVAWLHQSEMPSTPATDRAIDNPTSWKSCSRGWAAKGALYSGHGTVLSAVVMRLRLECCCLFACSLQLWTLRRCTCSSSLRCNGRCVCVVCKRHRYIAPRASTPPTVTSLTSFTLLLHTPIPRRSHPICLSCPCSPHLPRSPTPPTHMHLPYAPHTTTPLPYLPHTKWTKHVDSMDGCSEMLLPYC